MKRYNIAAVLSLILGGLFAYIRFDDGDTNGAIQIATLLTLLGVTLFFLGKLPSRLIPLVIFLFVLGLSAHGKFMDGDIGSAVVGGILMILAVVLTLFENTSFIKEKIQPWLEPTSRVEMIVSFIVLTAVMLLFAFLGR